MRTKLPAPCFSLRQHELGQTYEDAVAGNTLVEGDPLGVMSSRPAASVHTVVTSPLTMARFCSTLETRTPLATVAGVLRIGRNLARAMSRRPPGAEGRTTVGRSQWPTTAAIGGGDLQWSSNKWGHRYCAYARI